MTPLEILKRLELLSWDIILVGWDNGWVNRNDIINYALQLLINGKDEGDINLAVIAGGDCYNDTEIHELVISYLVAKGEQIPLSKERVSDAIDKWRLAHLINIEESNHSDENKLSRLQDIYADFDYPPDMESCSIYSQDSTDPLVALRNTILQLRDKFQV